MKKNINDIKTLTHFQHVPYDEVNNLNVIIDREDPLFSVIDAYNYGYIQGKRAERARRKHNCDGVSSKSYASKLIELRRDRTQEEVAEALGISVTALKEYETENSSRIPRDEIKFKIANYYNISVRNIFN